MLEINTFDHFQIKFLWVKEMKKVVYYFEKGKMEYFTFWAMIAYAFEKTTKSEYFIYILTIFQEILSNSVTKLLITRVFNFYKHHATRNADGFF